MSSSKHLEDSDSTADPNDDGQLTIRIPNPRVYMARQSLWIGRRGKPRCDHCRSNNLKCDRVLPTCNHCSWSNHRECTYTPLPTPAHRGIPRCDPCRAENLKCDRNLPICSNCRDHTSATSCNYSPKKKYGSNTKHAESSFLPNESTSDPWRKPKLAPESPVDTEPEANLRAHTFYGQNIANSIGGSVSPSETESISDMDATPGRYKTGPSRAILDYVDLLVPYSYSGPRIMPHPIPSRSVVVDSVCIKPWSHPSFISLPRDLCQALCRIDPVEMPSRHDFDNALSSFQRTVMDELRETSCLSVDIYISVARSLANDDISSLSKRVRTWAAVHRFRSGSDKQNLILVPRETIFYMDSSEAEAHRVRFVAAILDGTHADQHQIYHYDRLPVQNQIYDLLTYAHRTHASASEMLPAVAALGFVFVTWPMAEMYVRLCRLCNLRNKQDQSYYSSDTSFPL